jgi:hypothetical protein
MTRDEEVYPDPESFKPERFIKSGTLNKDIRDPRDIVFGFGRRCVLIRSIASSFKTHSYSYSDTLESVLVVTWPLAISGCQSPES